MAYTDPWPLGIRAVVVKGIERPPGTGCGATFCAIAPRVHRESSLGLRPLPLLHGLEQEGQRAGGRWPTAGALSAASAATPRSRAPGSPFRPGPSRTPRVSTAGDHQARFLVREAA